MRGRSWAKKGKTDVFIFQANATGQFYHGSIRYLRTAERAGVCTFSHGPSVRIPLTATFGIISFASGSAQRNA